MAKLGVNTVKFIKFKYYFSLLIKVKLNQNQKYNNIFFFLNKVKFKYKDSEDYSRFCNEYKSIKQFRAGLR